ncbi:MAG: prolyl aminopeptidase [Elusimicrobiota bacterium]
MRKFYPPIKPYRQGRLRVSGLHTLHFEEAGNPKGRPVVFLHGGPGGGIDPMYPRYFHPKKWRIVLFDQRGCGKSAPHAELKENTTWDIVADIEKLRGHLGIERWVVFGGSWGSALALAYSQTHPERCLGLIVRGIFLLRRSELLWFYQEGASHVFPDAWEAYVKPIPPAERGDFITAYYKRLRSQDPEIRREAAKAWSLWEGSTSRLFQNPEHLKRFRNAKFADAFARIECHYFINGGFLKTDDQLLDNAGRIKKIPGVIVQGRYDMVCPMRSAWDLHRAWPQAQLVVVPDAGHSMMEPGIRSALLEATDRFARL